MTLEYIILSADPAATFYHLSELTMQSETMQAQWVLPRPITM
jgi:hypothetical protein